MFNPPTRDESAQRVDVLPQTLRDALYAENIVDFVYGISEQNHLNKDRVKEVATLVGYVIMAYLKPENLASAIHERTHIPIEVANAISSGIHTNIFIPLKADLDAQYIKFNGGIGIHIPLPQVAPQTVEENAQETAPITGVLTGPPQITQPHIEAPQTPVAPPAPPQTPSTLPQTPEIKQEAQAPFIIHKNSNIDRVEAPEGEDNLLRPYFYKPAPIAQNKSEQAPARLEIGELPEKKFIKDDGVGHTVIPTVKEVDYTKPELKADPFGRNKDLKDGNIVKEVPKTNNVHPDNIVDLKDLPK